MRLFAFLFCTLSAFAFDDKGVSAIKAALTRAIEAKQTPGAVYWCEQKGETVHWAQGNSALVPTKEAMTEDTIFDAASLTKVVATLPSVMVLVERGKVSLDAPVERYVPEFGHGEITVKHLLTHTSGLPPGIPKDTANPNWSGYEEGIKHACACVPDPLPGRVFRYSDVNFILLGEIVRRVSGRPLNEFAAAEVFGPLGMASSGFKPDAERIKRTSPTERDEHGQMLRGVVHDPTSRRMGGVAGHAGLFTTAADLAKYARFNLRGGPVLKDETLRLMQSVQTPITVSERRGLGWDMDSKYSRPRGELFELGSFGHTGFTGTAMWMDRATDSFYILLTTRLHPDGKGDVRDLYAEVATLTAKACGIKSRRESAVFARAENEVPTVLNGIDVLKREHFAALKGLRIGLITNHTGIDNERRPTIDILHEAKEVKLVKLFSPEHGIRGEQDEENIKDSSDAKTGLPVVSLYKDDQRAPKPEQLTDIDALVFDIQDIGCRFYTYIATLKACLEAAAKAGKTFIVLDRINPVRGDVVEGPAVPSEIKFTAPHPIAIRHGMTTGELAQMFNAELKMKAKLSIVKVQGWQRDLWFDSTALPWRNPSPNMRNINAAALYPGIGLLEYAISVGRGSETPFEVIGAPFINDRSFAHELNKLGLPGMSFVPERFKPTSSVFKDQECGGVHLIITNRAALRPLDLGLAIGHTLHRLHEKDFDLKKFNTLLNHDATIEALKADKPWKDISAMWAKEAAAFEQRRAPFLLYPSARNAK